MRHTTLLILTLIFVVSCSSSKRSRTSDASSSGAGAVWGTGGADGTDGGSTGSGAGSDGGMTTAPLPSACGFIYTCTQNCEFDPNCADSCIINGTDKAQALYNDLVRCVNECVENDGGPPVEESTCLEGWCNDELLACQQDSGEPGFCGDGYCMDYEKQGGSDGQFVGSTFCWQDCGRCPDNYCAENENFETTGGKESQGYCAQDCGFCGDGICYYGKDWKEKSWKDPSEICEEDCVCYSGDLDVEAPCFECVDRATDDGSDPCYEYRAPDSGH